VAKYRVVMRADGKLMGWTPEDQKKHDAHHEKVRAMGAGEFFDVAITWPRNLKYHQKFFVMLKFAFDHWEPEANRKRLTYKGAPITKNFERFREQILILAGHYEQSFDLNGKMHLDAKSIAWDEIDTDEKFAPIYNSVFDTLHEHIFQHYSADDMEEVLEQFQRFEDDNRYLR
jgi:hypothetical protein